MREQGLAVLVLSWFLGGMLVSCPVWAGKERFSDEEEIREALRIVRDRFNVRDWESLVGKIKEIEESLPVAPEDSVQVLERLGWSREDSLRFTEHAGMPTGRPRRPHAFRSERIYHDYITTCAQEYALEERKVMRGKLRALFDEIPAEVGLFFEVKGIEISGGRATAQVVYYFKAMVDTERSRGYTSLGKRAMTLRLEKREGRWKLKGVKEWVDEMKATAKR